MKSQKKFGGFDSILARESLIKSLLLGGAIGAGVGFVLATVYWFLNAGGLIIALSAFAGVTLVLTLIFYKTLFSPTVKSNARRLDRHGLDERMITMVELEGDDSYIAKMQREDALESLDKLDKKSVKLKISKAIVVLFIVFGVLLVAMTAVEGLSQAGILPTGTEVWLKLFPPEPPEDYNVVYLVGKGGYLIGEDTQTVTEGENGNSVLAVAEDGYMFLAWSDGHLKPSRTEKKVTKDIEVTAIFIEVKDDLDKGDDEDEPDDVPGDGPGRPGDGDPSGGGGKYEEVNQVIDGDTYYRDVYKHYYEDLLRALEERDDIPDNVREIIEAYFNIIK